MRISLDNKVLTLVAVRLKSARLPRKALADLHGEPLIIRLTERVRGAKIPAEVIWCTSTNNQDDPLEQLASERGITCFRGSKLDVMSRFIEVADQKDASTVVRITGDNPLTDPVMMDTMIKAHLKKKAEYTYTDDLPVGTRPEIINVKMLKRCHKLLQDPNASEYMTWMLNRPEHFKTLHVPAHIQKIRRPEISLTVDTEDDLRVTRAIYEKFEGNPPVLEDIISWLDLNPELINKNSYPLKHSSTKAVNYKLVVD
jgi:spore coat polysaccharide biosynthesis protein SpsF